MLYFLQPVLTIRAGDFLKRSFFPAVLVAGTTVSEASKSLLINLRDVDFYGFDLQSSGPVSDPKWTLEFTLTDEDSNTIHQSVECVLIPT